MSEPITIITDTDDDDFANETLAALTLAELDDFGSEDHEAGHIAVPLVARKGYGSLHTDIVSAEVDGRMVRLALGINNEALYVYIEGGDGLHLRIGTKELFLPLATIIDEHFKIKKAEALIERAGEVHQEDQPDEEDTEG